MNIWLVTVGEPLPTDSFGDKLHRTGVLAEILVKRGHDVTWWTSTFDHIRKKHRYEHDNEITVRDNFRIKLLHSTGYKKNISLMRFVDHWGLGYKFKKQIEKENKPDLILASMPTLELCETATLFGKRHDIPVVIDLRDMWPDIFLDAFPRISQKFVKPFMYPLFKSLKRSCCSAKNIIGITPEFVNWGLECGRREKHVQDRQFWLAYSSTPPPEEEIEKAKIKWKNLGIEKNLHTFLVSFFGTMSKKLDMDPVLDAAKRLESDGRKFLFILCGNGDELNRYKKIVAGNKNVIFPGWIGAAEIWALMSMSDAGLAPYLSRFDFTQSIPTKAIEYFAAGLPVVSSLQGSLKNLLQQKSCGRTYPNGDADALVGILLELSSDPFRLKHMSRASLNLFEEEFMGERVYGDLADYLESQSLSN